jgi:membrane protease subunit HflC
MKPQTLIRGAVSVLVLIVLFSFMLGFQVRQNEQVVLTRLGNPVRVIQHPGLYLKWPWPIEKVNRFDARLNFYEIRLSEALTKDKRNVVVPAFVAWRITNPQKFLEAIASVENAQGKLDSLVSSAKNTVLGSFDFNQLVSVKPEDVKLAEIETKIIQLTSGQALHSFGIQIEQVGIERVTLPEVNTSFVFERMRAERAQFAARYRAEGQQEADAINAQTDAEKTVLLAEARKSAEETRGKAEAEVAHIYSGAHQEQPDLYRFLRELEALKKVVNQNTTLVLDANSPPFDLLKTGPLPAATPAP